MLQVISGKFFKTDDRYRNNCKGISYSNYSWVAPIRTCIATLEPVSTYLPVSSYVISYVNQIEKESRGGLGIVQTGNTEIIQQFQLLCMFGLKAYFDIDRNDVELQCRKSPKNNRDDYVPSQYIQRILSTQIMGNSSEIEYFIKFVEKVIDLPRDKYESVIKYLNNYKCALQIMSHNVDLSYSILVYCLESLCQDHDRYNPVWQDYPEDQKSKLDFHLDKIENKTGAEIRKILLCERNLKLRKRYIKFIFENIDNTFFTTESEKINNAIRKSELERALQNTYNMRSGFVHQLKPIMKQLKIPQINESEVFFWENEPYLTFKGLFRIVQHVLNNFIWKQESVKTEDYDWRNNLPGIIMVEMVPEYWVAAIKDLKPAMAVKKYSGFLNNLQKAILTNGGLINLSVLLEKYEALIPSSKKKYQIPMLATYCLYNAYIEPKGKRPGYQQFLDKYQQLLDECSIEMMIVWMILKQKWDWSVEECVIHYNNYKKKKFKKFFLKIPLYIELCLIIEIANIYLRNEKIDKYEEWLDYAYLDAAGKTKIQEIICTHKNKKDEVDINSILKSKKES